MARPDPRTTSSNAGRRGRRWARIKTELRLQHQAEQRPCCLCRQPIDYTLRYPDKRSWTAQHLADWANHPALREDPANLDAAHLDCNSSDGNRQRPAPDPTSEAW